jgi:uncharacterized membrane protein YebE (DUF533 family)
LGADDVQGAHREYKILCQGVYIDGVVNVRERGELERRRLELGLDADEAKRIEAEAAPSETWEYMHLVRGVLVDGVIDEQERAFLDEKARELAIDPWVRKRIEEVETEIRNGALDDLNADVAEPSSALADRDSRRSERGSAPLRTKRRRSACQRVAHK